MSLQSPEVNPVVEPQLFPGGALAITLEALVDPQDATVIFVVRAVDVQRDKLVALWSSSPVPFEDHGTAQHRAISELRMLLHEHTGPF